jgi:hypothetical protein
MCREGVQMVRAACVWGRGVCEGSVGDGAENGEADGVAIGAAE